MSAGRNARLFFLFASIVLLVLAGLVIYVFVLAPPFVPKPELEKPELLRAQTIPLSQASAQVSQSSTAVAVFGAEHLRYLLNEAGAYRLHANPLTKDLPELEFRFSDLKKVFTATITDNVVEVREGSASSPDFRIDLDQGVVVELLTAKNTQELVRKAMRIAKSKKYRARVLTTEKDLLLKGYLGVYQELQGMLATAEIVGTTTLPSPGTGLFLSYFGTLFILLVLLVLSLRDG